MPPENARSAWAVTPANADWISALIALGAAVALFCFKRNVIHVIGACALTGLLVHLAR